MARGVSLDRRKRYEVQHGTGVPTSTTKGNIYIEDVSGIVWTRAEGDIWIIQAELDDLWTRTGTILSPLNTGDGLNIESTADSSAALSLTANGGPTEEVKISSLQGTGDSAIILTSLAGGMALYSNAGMTLGNSISGATGDISITNTADGGNVYITKTGPGTTGKLEIITVNSIADNAIHLQTVAGGIDIDAATLCTINTGGLFTVATGGTDGTIGLNAGGTTGNINLNTNGQTANINLTAFGTESNINLSARGTTGLINLSTVDGGDGTIAMDTGGGNANITMDTAGGNGSIEMTTRGAYGNITLDLVTAYGPVSSGIFSTFGRTIQMNGKNGVLISNKDFTDAPLSIVQFADGTGKVNVSTGPNHLLDPGDMIAISGTTNYDGTYIVSAVIASNQFQISHSWDGDDATGSIHTKSGPGFLKIGDESTNNALHLGSSHGDILIETTEVSCKLDIILSSCDDIIATAVGETTIDSGFSSHFKITADHIDEQILLLSATNAGTGKGTVNLLADNNINIDKTVDAIGILAFGGPNSGDNTSVIIGPGYAEANSSVVMTSGSINIGGAASTDLKLIGSSGGSLALTLTASNGGLGNAVINLVSNELQIGGVAGATGTFLSGDSTQKTITVTKGIITSIV